jgi:RimJ/RimL family protein N-acetyltransferase
MTCHRQDGDILVRPLSLDDAPALHQAVRNSISSLSQWLPWCHAAYSLSDAEGWVAHCVDAWERRAEFPLGIFSSKSGEVLGGAGLNHINHVHRSANLGYWVGEPHCGKGVATRAAALAAAIGFEDLEFVRLEIVTLSRNLASRRVAAKLGATCEAEARNRLMFQGKPATAVVYSLIPGDMAANIGLVQELRIS